MTILSGLVAAAWVVAGFFLAMFLTNLVRRYALSRSLLDMPNDRSSHSVPTPRGGGLAIAVTLALGAALLAFFGILSRDAAWAFLGGGALVAGVGWLDDHRHVPPGWRALAHVCAAVWALYWLGGLPQVDVGGHSWHLGWPGSLLALFGMVWLINLYNFMDGIDGIAGVEAVTAGLGGAVLLAWGGAPGLAMMSALLAAACGGFLRWNWSPAKIFMGDIGSGLLGYCFAVLALAGENSGSLPVLVWLLLLGVFMMDATFTLMRRVMRGERWYTAHRGHAYQRLVQLGYPHYRVSLGVAGLNLLLLLPAALLSALRPAALIWCLLAMAAAGGLLWSSVQKRFLDASSQK